MKTKNKSLNFFNNFNIISNNPHRVYLSKKIYENISLVDNIDEDSFIDLLSHTDNLVLCKKDKNKLAKKISNTHSSFLPNEVLIEHTQDTYDNLENRFIKYVISKCIRKLELFQIKFLNNEKQILNTSLISENKHYIQKLNHLLKFTYLKYVSDINHIPMNSTILTRKDGYRNLFSFYLGLNSVPTSILNNNLEELIENKSIDVLYEIFCFFSIVNILANIYDIDPKKLQYKVITNDFSKTLSKVNDENYFIFEPNNTFPKIKVHYNKTYSNPDTYSKKFDPDISIEVMDTNNAISSIYIFDAKFKVNLKNKEGNKKHKLDDITKMHAYKDAIVLARSAFVLYPGTKNEFYRENTLKSAVGAISLNPINSKNNISIMRILKLLLRLP